MVSTVADLRDSLGAIYVYVPGGNFSYSVTRNQETLPSLLVAKHVVRNRFYNEFILYLQGKNRFNSKLPIVLFHNQLNAIARNNFWGADFESYLKEGGRDFDFLFRSLYECNGKFGSPDKPVVGVSCYAAKAYCLWLSLLLDNENPNMFRLPMEREWEFIAAGTTGREYPWSRGEGSPSALLANYSRSVDSGGETVLVDDKSKGATPEGVYGMAGNVLEWTNTKFDDNSSYVLRGGAWFDKAEQLKNSFRSEHYHPTTRTNFIGFRVVCDACWIPSRV